MTSQTLNLIVGISYLLMLPSAFAVLVWIIINRSKNARRMKINIHEKIKKDIDLTPRDIIAIGKSLSLSAQESRKAVYKVYRDASDKGLFDKLKLLLAELESEEPLDDFPDEVKPSLIRLEKLAARSGEDSDKHLLLPVLKTLNQYVELRDEQGRLRKRANWAYAMTVVGVLIGGFSFYATLQSPTAEEIASKINAMSTMGEP